MSRAGKQQSLRNLKRIGLIAGVAAIAVAALGIGSRMFDESSLARTTKAEAVQTVSVIIPKRGTKDQTLTLPGDIQAYFEAPIYARVGGYLKGWDQDIGAHVKAGQLLGEIDTPDLDQQLNQQALAVAGQKRRGV
jgi:multidrug efflux pump subunit AcrA (membrane-fusion protein)